VPPTTSSFAFLTSAAWWRRMTTDAFGGSFLAFLAGAAFLGAICGLVKGAGVVRTTLLDDLDLISDLLPRIFVALSIAALIWVMLPRERMSALVGQNSGLHGLAVATVAGTVTPGGPSSAYALLSVLAVSGADRGALVAYITAWATLGLQRILIWEVSFLGPEFVIHRFAACAILPIVAGLVARRLPVAFDPKRDNDAPEGRRGVKA
jgi:uncharacterized membrane protein YraQ (UPF0718 family)